MYRSRGILAAHCPPINIYNQVRECPSGGIKVTTEASIHPTTMTHPNMSNGTIKNEDSVLLQEALEPHYIQEAGGSLVPLI